MGICGAAKQANLSHGKGTFYFLLVVSECEEIWCLVSSCDDEHACWAFLLHTVPLEGTGQLGLWKIAGVTCDLKDFSELFF